MSVKFLNAVINTLKNNLPRLRLTTGLFRPVAVMETVTAELKKSKDSTRYRQRYMKRQWEDDKRKDDDESAEKKHCDQPTDRVKRKKMAMLLGYCGVDYYGMQRNPGVSTIEEDLLKALLEAKYITEEGFKNQQIAQFQRSSRTDKGVSAARQVVSLKMPLEANIEEINKSLPECIRVFAIKRVTKGFNSKLKCNARTYSYTLPTYAFDADVITDGDRRAYRVTPEKLDEVNNVLSVYKGSKNYHNFTEKKFYKDPSSVRFMMQFGVDRVFVQSDMEFAVFLVKGQSFMLHQIRKMVGLALSVVRGHSDISILERVFGREKLIMPTAPGLGLVLDMVHYDQYDSKFNKSHDNLKWESEHEEIEKFKKDFIYPNIVKGEIEGDSMGMWLEKLATHTFEPSEESVSTEVTEDSNTKEDCQLEQNNECKVIEENKITLSNLDSNKEDIDCKVEQNKEDAVSDEATSILISEKSNEKVTQ